MSGASLLRKFPLLADFSAGAKRNFTHGDFRLAPAEKQQLEERYAVSETTHNQIASMNDLLRRATDAEAREQRLQEALRHIGLASTITHAWKIAEAALTATDQPSETCKCVWQLQVCSICHKPFIAATDPPEAQ